MMVGVSLWQHLECGLLLVAKNLCFVKGSGDCTTIQCGTGKLEASQR